MFEKGVIGIFAFEQLILSFLYLSFGIFVLVRNPKNRIHKHFFFSSVLLFLISFFEFLVRQSSSYREAFFWLKCMFFWPFVAVSWIHLVILFSGFYYKKSLKLFVILSYSIASVFALFHLFFNTLLGEIKRFYWGWSIGREHDLGMLISFGVFSFMLIFSGIVLFRGYQRNHDEEKRKRTFYVFLGIFLPILLDMLFLVSYHIWGIPNYKIITEPFLISVVVIAYAIKKEEIFKVSLEQSISDVVLSIDFILFMVDINGRIVWANRKFFEFFGYPETLLSKLKFTNLIPSVLKSRVVVSFSPFVLSKLKGEEISFVDSVGREKPVTVNIVDIKDKNTNVVGYIVSASDISEKRAIERKYRFEEEKFKNLFEFMPYPIGIIDLDGNLQEGNNAIKVMFGFSREEFIGKNILDFPWFTPYDVKKMDIFLERLRTGKGVESEEFKLKSPIDNGKELILEVIAKVFRGEIDNMAILIMRDITERRIREIRIADTLSKLSTYREAIDKFAVFVEVDREGFIRDINEKFCSVFGIERDKIIGHHIKELDSGGISEKTRLNLLKNVRKNEVWRGILKFILKSHEPIYLDMFVQPFRENGVFTKFWLFGFDVTELKRLIEETKRLEAVKTIFLANMSHELRTPLNGVLGFIELLSETELTEEQWEYIRNIKNSAQGLLDIISDILDFSKIERGKLNLEYVEFNIIDIAESIMNIFISSAEKREVDLLLYVDPKINYSVEGDSLRIKQVIINFISNAIKFTNRGGSILFEINLNVERDDYYDLTFSVSDTGVGIPKDKLDKIFDEFYQVDKTLSKGYGGSGLGLAISRELVRLMGGEIKVKSEYGKGTQFSFDIALKKVKPITNEINFDRLRKIKVAFLYSVKEIALSNLMRYFNSLEILVDYFSNIDRLLEEWERRGNFDLIVIGCSAHDSKEDILNRVARVKNLPALIICSTKQQSIIRESAGKNHIVISKPFVADELAHALEVISVGDIERYESQNYKKRVKQRGLETDLHLEGNRILLVEDNEINRQLMVKILEKYKLEIDVAEDGERATEIFRENYYDLVFMDISMPVMDGVDASVLIRMIERKQRRSKHTPIVALTAHAVRGDRERYLNGGMDDYITKPISIGEIERVLKKFLLSRDKRSSVNKKRAGFKGGKKIEVDIINKSARELGLDYEFVRNLMSKFIHNSKKLIVRLYEEAKKNDLVEVAKIAHFVKGASGNLRLDEIFKQASVIEENANKEKQIDYIKEVEKLEDLIKILEKFVSGKMMY